MASYLNQPRPKSMQGGRSHYSKSGVHRGALFMQVNDDSTNTATVYGNSFAKDMKIRDEARKRGNMAIRIMSGKSRPRTKVSNSSKEVSNERY